ncbi:MAG: M24 family metallopeptidase [Chloroflexi bacterium]|nr:M24 family metallopeptidase [Chloroflexota bacterium]
MSTFYPYGYKGYPKGLEYPWTYATPSEKERERRWEAIRSSMRKHDLDCLIVGGPFGYMTVLVNHLYYISNYQPYVNKGTFVVFPLEGEPQLGVNNVLGPQFLHVASETSWIKEIVASLNSAQDVVRKIKQLKLEHGRLGIVGYKMDIFPAATYNALRESLPGATFEDATVAMEDAMDEVSRTSPEELALLRKACQIHDLWFKAVAEAMRPGVMECELWATAEKVIVENGGWYPHFMLVTSGPSPTFLRAPASRNRLNPGDVILFETDVLYGGVEPQTSFALSLGRPKREVEEMFEFCREMYEYALVELEKNRTFMDIEVDLVNRIHAAGYEPMTPQIHRYNMSGATPMGSPPRPGDRFTVHPNVGNKDYTASGKIGDCIRINEQGKVERLQSTAAQLHIVEV